MPTYDYQCQECGVFEHFQSMTEPALERCPTCGSSVKRMVSGGTGVIFKGSGFFNTDRKASSPNGGTATTAAKPEAKTETKPEPPAAKTDTSPAKDSA